MDLPNILNNRNPAAAAAAAAGVDQPLQSYADVNGRAISDTASERGLSPHVSESAPRFSSASGPQYASMGMGTAPHLQQHFSIVPNPYPTPTESVDSAYAHAQNDDQQLDHLQGGSTSAGSPAQQVKTFACSSCHKGFARRSDLARHERIHSGVRPHVCEHHGCGKQFIQRSALTVHSRVHTGEKPHMCEHCTKPFSDSSSLARHRRIHSGKRPYKCPYADCQKTFTRRTTLTRHQSHHSGTVEESIQVTNAALASRPGNAPVKREGMAYSEPGSSRSSPRSEHKSILGPMSNGELAHVAPLLPRQPNDFYIGSGAFPAHLRDFGQNSPRSGSQSPSLSGFGLSSNRPSFTSHPAAMYGLPPVLEPPAKAESRSTGSASGSPHLSNMGWPSPGPGSMGSPVPGNHQYGYPEPADLTSHLYFGNGFNRRPQSTEPDQYEMKPRLGSNNLWTEPLSQ